MPYETTPIVQVKAAPMHGDQYEHPAFATISASRINGGDGNLFGSNIKHHHGAVRIRINKAHLTRNLGQDRIHGSAAPYVEVELSEAQWVAFISRMNAAGDTPCTLRYRQPGGDGPVPGIESIKQFEDKLKDEAETMIRHHEQLADGNIEKIISALDGKVSKKLLDDVKKELERVKGHGHHSRQFHIKQLREHSERMTVEAKIEMESLVTATITRLGLSSIEQLGAVLSSDPKALLQLAHNPTKED